MVDWKKIGGADFSIILAGKTTGPPVGDSNLAPSSELWNSHYGSNCSTSHKTNHMARGASRAAGVAGLGRGEGHDLFGT